MKLISVFAIAVFSASLAQTGAAQVGSPTNTDASSQTKQEKPNAKKTPKDKAKATKPIKPETGKKTTTSQDAAYALAYRAGTPETSKPTPK